MTGCNGFIGSAFIRFVKDKYHIIGLDLTILPDNGCETALAGDIQDVELLKQIFAKYPIDVVVHTAAEKSLVRCETDKPTAARLNYLAASNLLHLAQQHQAKMVFLSSDQVFDGKTGGYQEDAPTKSINFYGCLKECAECVMLKDDRAAICRTALVFGEIPQEQFAYFDKVKEQRTLAVQGYIVQQTKYCLEHGLPIELPADEFVSPTHVMLLAKQLDTVIEKDISGILHCCGKGRISRYEMGQCIAHHFALDRAKILPEGTPNPLRPKDVSLDCTKTEKQLGFQFETFAQQLQRYM